MFFTPSSSPSGFFFSSQSFYASLSPSPSSSSGSPFCFSSSFHLGWLALRSISIRKSMGSACSFLTSLFSLLRTLTVRFAGFCLLASQRKHARRTAPCAEPRTTHSPMIAELKRDPPMIAKLERPGAHCSVPKPTTAAVAAGGARRLARLSRHAGKAILFYR